MSIINKLVAVFGLNVEIKTNYTKNKVTYGIDGSELSFDYKPEEGAKVKSGSYLTTIKEKASDNKEEESAVQYELMEVVDSTAPAAASKAKSKVRQSPDFGYPASRMR